jgi:hypothetical protein
MNLCKFIPSFLAVIWVVAFSACSGKPVSLSDLFKTRGRPVAIASGYDYTSVDEGMIELSLYSVVRDPSTIDWRNPPTNCYLIFARDAEFLAKIKWHFISMNMPEEFTGSTMFLARDKSGTNIEIARLNDNQQVEIVLQKDVGIAYIEVGEKAKLIRKRTQERKR